MGGAVRIEVVYALPERAFRYALDLVEGATVAEALALVRDRLAQDCPGAEIDAGSLACFGRCVSGDMRLRSGDRIELLRPLQADPKQARRQRAGTPARR